ncbi:MAG: YceI family protein [Actinobacteria bacterium]|nr:YceI family protein [Actinomycetota bacterium]MBW3650111.1 YceI family protein [Actinomycetota bacterium]
MSIPTTVEVLDQLTGSYQPDPAHSRLGFSARHAMVTTVHGWFDSFRGRVHLDGHDPRNCSVTLTIDAESIRTNNLDRDAHLRSADFFDVERYPTITFESCDVMPLDDRRYKVTGNLNIRSVTRAVDLELTHQGNSIDPYGQFRVGFEGSGALKRSDWGLTWNVALETGGVVLSDRINLEFDLSLVKTS